MATEQHLSKNLFDKYEDESIFAASQCGLLVSTSMNPESVAAMVDDANINLTKFRIICNYIRDAFGKSDILTEEAVKNLGTGYMRSEYGTYEYEKDKGTEKDHINFWYRKADCILTFELSHMMCVCSGIWTV